MKISKLTSVILAAMMTATAVPFNEISVPYNSLTSYAVKADEEPVYEQELLGSGECGENLIWEVFKEESVLVISGEGDMANWESSDAAPWAAYGENITNIVIESDIKSIGENCFDMCTNLFEVSFYNPNCRIPDSETAIPENAVIAGYEGSTAQAYAEKYGREFSPFYFDDDYSGVTFVDEGMCGDSLSWTLTDVGGLNISGEGEMTDYESFEDTPWASYGDFVTLIGIDENVSNIDAEAFAGFENLLVASIESIDCYIPMEENVLPVQEFITCYENSTAQEYADMFGIDTLILSSDDFTDDYDDETEDDYVTDDDTFYDDFTWSCNEDGDIFYITGYGDMPDYAEGERPWEDVLDQIEYVYFYGNITSIGKNAFAGCTNLKFVDIDEKIEYIGEDAFKDCINLETLNFHGNYTCEIYDSADTIPTNTNIIAHAGTPAQDYADKYNMTYYGISGDANCDGKVSIADATAVFQSIGNPDKYALSDEGKRNADVADKGNGITAEDAILIQKYDAKEVKSL